MHEKNPEVLYRHYEPRLGLKEELDRLLKEALAELPSEADVRMAVIDAGDRYCFSAVAEIGRAIFSSDIVVTKSAARGRERHWQMEPTAKCLRDLVLQVQRASASAKDQKGSA